METPASAVPPSAPNATSSVEAAFVEENDTLYLRVKNLGAAARFRAQLTFQNGLDLYPPRTSVYGVWDQAQTQDVEIFTGESRDLRIASISARSRKELVYGYSWHFDYLEGTALKRVTTDGVFNRNYLEHSWEGLSTIRRSRL